MSGELWALMRDAAEAAAEVRPGPWKVWAMEVLADPKCTSNLDDAVPVARTSLLIDGKPRTHLADFIATCDPTAVLALLDERDALRAQVERVRALADAWADSEEWAASEDLRAALDSQ